MSVQEPLPLSWARSGTCEPVYRSISLPLSRATWIPFANIPKNYTLSSVKKDLEDLFPEGFLVRGCSKQTAGFFKQKGGAVLRTGAEAVLCLQNGHFEKKSLRKLLHQAEKKGRIVEVPLNDENKKHLLALQRQARHSAKPQLANVFRTYPFDACRCFVLCSFADEWLAAVTITTREDALAHTELMLKRDNSPPGIMEFLLAGVFDVLRQEGFFEWSLGEVPFFHLGQRRNVPSRLEESIVVLIAELFRDVYDFRGLFYFKNKFYPQWRDVYLYSLQGISLLTLADMAVKTRYAALVGQKVFNVLKEPFFSDR